MKVQLHGCTFSWEALWIKLFLSFVKKEWSGKSFFKYSCRIPFLSFIFAKIKKNEQTDF
jgi:hypothetical protein